MKSKFFIGIIVFLVIVNVFMIKYLMDKEVNLIYKEDELAELLQEIYPTNIILNYSS